MKKLLNLRKKNIMIVKKVRKIYDGEIGNE